MADARVCAVNALLAVSAGTRPKTALVNSVSALDSRDAGFVSELVYGVLRQRIFLDWVLDRFLKKPGALPEFTRENLRCAAYQILFLRVADHAAVHCAVETEKTNLRGKMASVVNAVLRNLLRRRAEIEPGLAAKSEAEALSIRTSHPLWMIRRWIARFGLEGAHGLAEANNALPPLALRAQTLRTTRDELCALLLGSGVYARPGLYSPDAVIVESTRTYADLAAAQGLFVVQDEASQLISRLVSPKPGMRVLDACAAPGGKTGHMAQLMNDSGEVIALERDPGRARLLRETMSALGLQSVRTLNADILDYADPAGFDRVLVDAPCSSFGIIRKNPDVKYGRSAADLAAHAQEQLSILAAAARHVKSGGLLVYSVCSTEPEEGEEVVRGFLKTFPEFRIIDPGDEIPGEFVQDSFFRAYPHTHGTDGFFGVILCRTA